MNDKKAVILLSGGLDSATVVAMAKAEGYSCYSMSFDYGQRHRAELQAAERVARQLGVVEHKVIGLNLNGIGGSALTDSSIAVPESPSEGIPATYVPARNTVFLALALGWAEVLEARDIFIGVNAVDYSLPGLPSRVRRRLRAYGQPGDQGGCGRAGLCHPRTAAANEQGRDHPGRYAPGRGLRTHGLLLPGR